MFEAPLGDGPLMASAEIATIPVDATISGMFLIPMVAEASRLERTLPSARARYSPFQFYSLREHVTLMFEAAGVLFPDHSPRRALRKLGRGAASALLSSMLGRVMFSSVLTPLDSLSAMAKSYELNLKPGRAQVVDHGPGFAIVELKDVHYLLDTHHVGVMEGLLGRLGIRPEVKARHLSGGHAELLVSWGAGA